MASTQIEGNATTPGQTSNSSSSLDLMKRWNATRSHSPPSAKRDTRNAPSAPTLTTVFGVLPKAQIVGACTPRTCAKDHSDSR